MENVSALGKELAGGSALPDVSDYYLCQWGTIYGPTPLTKIAEWIGDGRVTPRDWLFVPTICDWLPILEVPDMVECFYRPSDKPIGPPAGVPVDLYLKYYKSQGGSPPDSANLPKIEKRQWIRIPLGTPMTYRIIRDMAPVQDGKVEAHTVNISEGGIGFETPTHIVEGEVMEIWVDFFPVTLHSEVRVAHCAIKSENTYVIGAAFRNLPPAERDKIRHFIRSCLHNASRGAPTRPAA